MAYRKPVAYQEVAGERRYIEAAYALAGNGQISFRIGKYDTSRTLVIDPILNYSSFLWGTVTGVAVDSAGNTYVVGYTSGTDLPATGGYQTRLAGSTDAYIAKLDPSGKKLLYATYLGARRATTYGKGIAVDGSGNAYIFGTTDSSSFPVTSGSYQTSFSLGSSFVTKLNATGNALVYSTFINGSITAIAVDGGGNTFMTGTAAGIVTTAGAFQPSPRSNPSPFIAKLNASGSAMAYATYLGGQGSQFQY